MYPYTHIPRYPYTLIPVYPDTHLWGALVSPIPELRSFFANSSLELGHSFAPSNTAGKCIHHVRAVQVVC